MDYDYGSGSDESYNGSFGPSEHDVMEFWQGEFKRARGCGPALMWVGEFRAGYDFESELRYVGCDG
jgi:hypothetical protein